jgi:dihydroneopterin aldolase
MADKQLKAAKRTGSAKLKRSAKRKIAATALDRVFMHDLVLEVEIGVYTHEKGVTQRVRISVDVDVIPTTVALDDNIGRAFDYDTIIKGTKDLVARGHIKLVETLAEDLAMHCLAHPRASAVTIRIEKLDKEPGAVGVEIRRGKGRA